jgi:hypothetical protein
MTLVRRFVSRAAAKGVVVARIPRKMLVDIAQLGCAFLLFLSPFCFVFPPLAAWDLWITGYSMLTVSVAALVAEAEWEPQANLLLGLWLVAAPWTLGISHETAASLVHLTGGVAISLLSAVELWHAEQNPPRRFGPAAAQRPDLISLVSATAPAGQRQVSARSRRPDRRSQRRYASRFARRSPAREIGCEGGPRAAASPGQESGRAPQQDRIFTASSGRRANLNPIAH